MDKVGKITPKRILKAVGILYGVFSVIFWMHKADALLSSSGFREQGYVSLNDSWEIMIGDELYEDISIDNFTFDAVSKGEEVTMVRTLPDEWDIVEGALRLHTNQTALRIYIDDEQIYENGYDRMNAHKSVGGGYQFVKFPSEYKGKSLKIHMYISEDRAFSKFDSVRIYEWENAYRVLMTENRYPMFFGCFLVIFGLVTSLITICALAFSSKYVRMLCVSLFSILIGIWTLGYYDVISIFSIPLYSISLLEYISLYLAPIPLLIYLWEDVKNLKSKVLGGLYKVILTVQIVASSIMLSLHAFDIVHCAATLKYMQMLILIGLIFFVTIEFLNIKDSKGIERFFIFGMLFVVACISYDLFGYQLNRYWGRNIFTAKGVTAIGVVVFIFILISSFYVNLTQSLMQEAERALLIKRAYVDELTQIHNRRYCMEYMEKLGKEKENNYTVVCMDLNNLKITNDTYGHAKGDILIKSAAEVISDTFGEVGVVARMGGDEFIAILNTSDSHEVAKVMERFQINMSKKNKEVEDLNMSIAYGYAVCNGKDYDVSKIYQIADDRMYENKKKMKKDGEDKV